MVADNGESKVVSRFHSRYLSLSKSTVRAFSNKYEEQIKSVTIQKRRPSGKIDSQLKGRPKLLEIIDDMMQGCIKIIIQYTYYFSNASFFSGRVMHRVQFQLISFENYERKYFQNVLCVCVITLFYSIDKIN